MAVINIDDAYILDNTGKQVDDAVDYALYNSNRNLLDNPWFTVRQRGDGPFASAGYTVDRWRNMNSSATATFTSDGVTLTADSTGGFRQPIESELNTFLAGKTVTFSILYQDGTIDVWTFEWSASHSNRGTKYNTTIYAGGTNGISINRSATIYIRAVKLELGPFSTLANDAPPNYVEELTKCKAYFERIKTANRATYGYFGAGVAYDTTHAIIIVPMTPKIGDFSITSGGSFRLSSGSAITVTSIAFSGSRMTNTAGVLATASGLTVGSAYLLQANNDSTAHIDITSTVFD